MITSQCYWYKNQQIHSIQCEGREKTNNMQQSDVYYQLLSQHVSGIIMPIFSARILQRSAPQPLPTTSSRTRAVHRMKLTHGLCSPEDGNNDARNMLR